MRNRRQSALNEREPVRRLAPRLGRSRRVLRYEAPETRQERNRASPSSHDIAPSSVAHPRQEGNQCTSLAALHESVCGRFCCKSILEPGAQSECRNRFLPGAERERGLPPLSGMQNEILSVIQTTERLCRCRPRIGGNRRWRYLRLDLKAKTAVGSRRRRQRHDDGYHGRRRRLARASRFA